MVDRNPMSVYALTIDGVKDLHNYHPAYAGQTELWLPITTITSNKIVYHDALIGEPVLIDGAWHQWTWNTVQGPDCSAPKPLVNLGIVPFDDGTWVDCYTVADSEAHKVIQHLLSS